MGVRRGARAESRAPQSGRSPEFAEQPLPAFVPPQLRPEWAAISHGRRSFLLAGAPSATDAMLASMLPHFREPIQLFNSDMEQPLPLPAEGTLILTEIGQLNANQQLALLAWMDQLDHRGPVQIVSTTSRQMSGLVKSGEFRAELYYRLNVVRIDLVEAATDHDG